MAYLETRKRKDGKTAYYARFYDPGRRPQKKCLTLRTTDKTAARHTLARLEREYAMGLFDPWTQAATREVSLRRAVGEFRAALLREVQSGAIGTRHAEDVASTARLFARRVLERRGSDVRLDKIHRADAEPFLHACVSMNTRWQYYSRLKRFFRWGRETGAMKSDPLEGIDVQPPRKHPPKYLTLDEFEALLSAAEAIYADVQDTGNSPDSAVWWGPFFSFAVATGMRNSELRYLRWQDVDLRSGTVRVSKSEVFTPKWGKGRIIPLQDESVHVLTDGHPFPDAPRGPKDWVWPSPHAGRAMSQGRTRTGRLNRGTPGRAFRVCADCAGLDPAMTFHSLRHTFASWMVQAGLPITDLQRLMGHKNVATTMVYAHASDESVRRHMDEAAERLRALRSK